MTVPATLLGRRAALTALAFGAMVSIALLAAAIGWLGGGAISADDRLQQLASLKAEAAARFDVERALDTLRVQAASHPSLLRGDNDALTEAALQSDLKAMVENNHGEVRSAYALPSVTEKGLVLISIQYDLMVPITKLRQLAYGIESRQPYLFLSAIDVSAPQPWPADPKAPEPRVEVRWTVSGYRRSAAP